MSVKDVIVLEKDCVFDVREFSESSFTSIFAQHVLNPHSSSQRESAFAPHLRAMSEEALQV